MLVMKTNIKLHYLWGCLFLLGCTSAPVQKDGTNYQKADTQTQQNTINNTEKTKVYSKNGKKYFIKSYTYRASDEDSKNSSRAIALRESKLLLLEEVGTYIQRKIEVQKSTVGKKVREQFRKKYKTLTAGITQTRILKENWNGETFTIEIEILVDENDVLKKLNKLVNNDALKQDLEKSNERANQALAKTKRLQHQITQLQQQLEQARKNNNQQRQQQIQEQQKNNRTAYQEIINTLLAEEYFSRGIIAYKNGNTQQALSDFNQTIKINPDDALAYYNRGVVYDDLGNMQQAISDYNQTIKINPYDADAYNNRGNAYSRLGNAQQAINDYNQAIKIKPNLAQAYYK